MGDRRMIAMRESMSLTRTIDANLVQARWALDLLLRESTVSDERINELRSALTDISDRVEAEIRHPLTVQMRQREHGEARSQSSE